MIMVSGGGIEMNTYKEYAVYGKESGHIKNFRTSDGAREFIKELKRFDKKEKIEDVYYIEELTFENRYITNNNGIKLTPKTRN